MSFDGFVVVVSVLSGREGGGDVDRGPQEHAVVLASRTYIPAVWTEAGSDLTRQVGVSLVFADDAEVPEVVQSDPAVGRGHQNLVLTWHWLDTRDLPAPGVFAPGRADVDG